MHFFKKSGLMAAIIAATVATGVSAQSWERVSDRDAFLSAVSGKTLQNGGSTAQIKANGTGSGTTGRGDYALNWVWDNGRYCRNFKFASQENASGTICAHVWVAGDQIRFKNLAGDRSESVWSMN